VPGKVILIGDLAERSEAERLIRERVPELHMESKALGLEAAERACQGAFDVAVILRGPISGHDDRIEAVTRLRRNGFAGRILYEGAFLTEKQDALAAGVDYVFDPDRQTIETVVRAAVSRPRLATDHPYLGFLFHGEWASLESYGDEPPAVAPDVILVSIASHADETFFSRISRYLTANPATRVVVVDDGGTEEAGIAALSAGLQPDVVPAAEGLAPVAQRVKRLLRDCWFSLVAAA